MLVQMRINGSIPEEIKMAKQQNYIEFFKQSLPKEILNPNLNNHNLIQNKIGKFS